LAGDTSGREAGFLSERPGEQGGVLVGREEVVQDEVGSLKAWGHPSLWVVGRWMSNGHGLLCCTSAAD